MTSNRVSNLFYFEHHTGDKLYPTKMENLNKGRVSFRVSPGGNTKESSKEVDEKDMERLVLQDGFSVRASTLNGKRAGLYKREGRSIRRVVSKNS